MPSKKRSQNSSLKEKTYDGPEYTAYLITGRVYYKLQIEYIIYCPSNIIASKDQLKKWLKWASHTYK